MAKRYFLQDFKTEYNEHTIIVRFDKGAPVFTTEELKAPEKNGYANTKEFPSLEAICAAIDRYELSLRKDFINPTAYRLVREWGALVESTFETVTVTSVIDGNYCWITRANGDRAKESMTNLFSDLDELKKHVKEKQRIDKEAFDARTKAEAVVNQFRWRPKKAGDA